MMSRATLLGVNTDPLDQQTIRENLQRARDRRDRAWAEYEAADREVKWWEQGQGMFGGIDERQEEGDALLSEVLPNGPATQRPTLRQALILVMRANPDSDWTVGDLTNALGMNRWMPKGFEPTKRITDVAGTMVQEGYLTRSDRGVYRLSTLLADALKRVLPPITDYRLAAELGMPVPDHPAASGGLGDD
jgi:hypothetical protein